MVYFVNTVPRKSHVLPADMYPFKIVALLLLILNPGIHSLSSEISEQDSGVTVQRKSVVPGLSITQEQIDRLADIIIRIHGVETDSPTEENFERVENLKLLVAKVNRTLQEKLEEKRRKEIDARK